MAQVIKIKRRLTPGAAGAPTAGSLTAGEMAWNETGNTLWIGGSGTPATIYQVNSVPTAAAPAQVGPSFTGTPASGDLWFDTTAGVNFLKIYDGAAWVPATDVPPAAHVGTTFPGTPGTGDLWFDTNAGVNALKVYSGTAWVVTMPPIEGPIIVTGNYNATTHQVHDVRPPAAPTLAENAPLPSTSAQNRGWLFLVSTAGTGIAPAPTVAMQPGDWLISSGSGAWTHLSMGAGPWLPINNPTATGVLTAPEARLTKYDSTPALAFGDTTHPNASVFGIGDYAGPYVTWATGAHYDGTTWMPSATGMASITHASWGSIIFAAMDGLTPGTGVAIPTNKFEINANYVDVLRGNFGVRSTVATGIPGGDTIIGPFPALATVTDIGQYLARGARYSAADTAWLATTTNATMMRQEFSATSPQFRFFANTGLTANTAFTPTEIAKLDATGFDLPTGHTYKVNGVNIMAAGTWLPVNNPQFTGNLITGPAYGLSDHDGTVNVRPLIFRDDAERFRLDDTLFPNNIIAFDASVTPATSARLMQNGTIGATNTIGSDDLMIARRMSFLEAAPGTGGLILINYLHTGEINTHGTGDITNQFGNIVALGGRVQAGYSRMGHINAPVAGYVAAFADHDQTNWIARGTSASILIQDMAPGNIPRFRFTSNTGTTIGAAFTPTQIAQIDPTGMNLPTGANYLVNGTNDWIDGGTY